MRYTIEQRKFVVEEFLVNNRNLVPVGPLFRAKFGIPPPQKVSMLAMIKKWEEKGTVHDQIKGVSGRSADVTTPENIAIVRDEFRNNPRQTLRVASQALQISKSSVHVILKKKLIWKPYKTQKRQAIPERCVLPRLSKSQTFIDAFNDQPELLESIWFTDEAHFELVPALNKQNNRYWAPEQPYQTIETELHPARTTAWGAISARGIYLTFFDETVEHENYIEMLDKEFIPFLSRNNLLEEAYLMQDGATPHTCNATLDFLNPHFHDRVISGRYQERFGYGLSWMAYSPDLNPCDFFLWGYLKSKAYMNRPKTIDELKAEILRSATNVSSEMLDRVVKNFKKRLVAVVQSQGRHIEQTAIMNEMRKSRSGH
ncbi:hypothetical protein HA402_003049 [Bradysia odoriphaga]|nr:hypothetical protein HA402_003049 [Bradysia odoriphaga]